MPTWAITSVEDIGIAQEMKSLQFFNRKKEKVLFNNPDNERGGYWDEDIDDEEDENVERNSMIRIEMNYWQKLAVLNNQGWKKRKEDVVIESENNSDDNNNSISGNENIYFNSENEDDDPEDE